MNFTERQKDLIKTSLKDFEYIKNKINTLIEKGRNLSEILDYLRHIKAIELTNWDLDDKDFRYIDFTYYSIDSSVIEDNEKGLRMQETIQIYDNVNWEYLIEDWLTKEEWLKECE